MSISVEELLKKYSAVELALDDIDRDSKIIEEQQKRIKALLSEAEKEHKAFNAAAKEAKASITSREAAFSSTMDALDKRVEDIQAKVKIVLDNVKEAVELIPDYETDMASINSQISEIVSRLDHLEEFKISVDDTEDDSIESDGNLEDEVEFEPIETEDGKIKVRLSGDEDWLYLDFDSSRISEPYRNEMRTKGWRWYNQERVWSNFPNQENYDYAVSIIESYDEEN